MGHLLLAALLSSQALTPLPVDLLESASLSEWAGIPLGAGSRVLLNGLPTGPAGLDRLPPWGSVESLRAVPPLDGGLWSAGHWSLAASGHSIPDSSYRTRVGLFQNTFDRHRYTGSLRRPLPWGVGLGVTAGREDSLRMEHIRMTWRGLTLDGLAWREDRDMYSAWLGGSPAPGVFGRLTLDSPREGSRWLGGLAGWAGQVSGLRLEAGAAGHASGDSSRLEAHALARLPLGGGLTLTARGDAGGGGDSLEYGWAAGLGADIGPLRATLGAVEVLGRDPEATASAAAGPAQLGLRAWADGAAASLGVGGVWGLSRFDLTAAADTDDSLRVTARALPGVRIVNARLRGGGRLRAVHGPVDGWDLHVDALAEYRLSTFSIVAGLEDLEDVMDGGTSFTYGVLWSFTDEAARPEEPEDGGEER